MCRTVDRSQVCIFERIGARACQSESLFLRASSIYKRSCPSLGWSDTQMLKMLKTANSFASIHPYNLCLTTLIHSFLPSFIHSFIHSFKTFIHKFLIKRGALIGPKSYDVTSKVLGKIVTYFLFSGEIIEYLCSPGSG